MPANMVIMLRRGFSRALSGFVDHGCATELAMWGWSALSVKLYALRMARCSSHSAPLILTAASTSVELCPSPEGVSGEHHG